MGIPAIIAVVSTGVQLYTGYKANKAANRQADAEEDALNEQRKQTRLQNLSTRRAEARKAMRLRAEARSSAGANGTGTSSNLSGTMSGVTQNERVRTSFLDTMSAFEDNKFAFQKQANKYASEVNDWNSAGQVAGIAYNAVNGSKALEKLF